MATPIRHTFEEREALIILAATHLFSKHGFEGTTTKMIALEAHVNEALIFRHFPKKEDLYTAIVHQKLHEWTQHVSSKLENTLSMDLEEALFEIAQLMVDKNKKDPTLLRMMLFSALEKHELSQMFFQQRLPLIEFLEKFFKFKIKNRKMRLLRVEEVARSFLGMIHHYILVSQVFHSKTYFSKTEKNILKSYVNIFINGIKT